MKQENNRYSILDELANSVGYDYALMTTFNFEINFFERAILNRLYANNIKKVTLFVDSGEFTKSLKEVNVSSIGRKYMVNAVMMMSSFHPKVILLLGKEKAKLFVGSCNIKTSGYMLNNEVFNYVEYSKEQPDCLDVINSAIKFFLEINKYTYQLDNKIIKEITELAYFHKCKENGNIFFIHNIEQSILIQLKNKINDNVESINIAVPYFDDELVALQEVTSIFPNAKVKLYVQNERSTFPIDYYKHGKTDVQINIFKDFNDNLGNTNFYHGKVYLFKTFDKAYVLYGSANCTQMALTKSFSHGGNIECDFLVLGAKNDFDYFFENFSLQSGMSLQSTRLEYETKEKYNFYYKYGEEKDQLELHIGYKKFFKGIKVYCEGDKLEYKDSLKEIVVFIPLEYKSFLDDIFEIVVRYDDKSETLRCWSFNTEILDNNRVKQSEKEQLENFDIESSGDKFIEDRWNLLKAEQMCLAEVQEYKRKMACFNQIKQEQEENSMEEEEFIVDVEIPDEYRIAYKQQRMIDKIRSTFIEAFWKNNSIKFDLSPNKIQDLGKKERKVKACISVRKASSSEKRFERFVKSRVKNILNDTYVGIIETEHFFGIILVILDIFSKYNYREKVEGIFDDEYVFLTKVQLLTKLLTKDVESEKENNLREMILIQAYKALLENYKFIMDEKNQELVSKYNLQNRELLLSIERKYSIRSIYEMHMKALYMNDNEIILENGLSQICKYIEELFGYKNYEQLEKYIQNQYEDSRVEIKNRSIKITAYTTNILQYDKPNTDVLKEIRNYSRYVTPINLVRIVIFSKETDAQGKNPIREIKHNIDLNYHRWNSMVTRKNGDVWNEKSRYLSF